MGLAETGALLVMAAAILIGSLGAAIAYQVAPVSKVAAFDFSYVAFAALWGLAIFSEIPDMLSFAGMALIVAAGILTLPTPRQA